MEVPNHQVTALIPEDRQDLVWATIEELSLLFSVLTFRVFSVPKCIRQTMFLQKWADTVYAALKTFSFVILQSTMDIFSMHVGGNPLLKQSAVVASKGYWQQE